MAENSFKRSIVILLCLIVSIASSYAQSGSISGRILDQQGEPIEYASVTIHSTADSMMINGVVTNALGEYLINNIGATSFYIEASFLGYNNYTSSTIDLKQSTPLEDIQLSINSTTLDEIQVTGKAITSSHKLDKQIYSAKQFDNAKGGTAKDILSNLPAVSINSFGEISVRGATGFLVMINGKPIQSDPSIILNQLSANGIEDIEIITAPSAKYDPDGNAGIINVITKQNIVAGTYIQANVLTGLPSIESYDNKNNTPRYGADFTLNHKMDKWDFTVGLDYRRYDISGRREGYVNTLIDGILSEFPSDGERSFDEENYSARLAANFTPQKNQSLNAGFYFGKRTKERTADILYNLNRKSEIGSSGFADLGRYYNNYLEGVAIGTPFTLSPQYFNENLRVRKGDFLIGSLDYSFTFPNGSIIKFAGLYERTILGGPTDNANLAYPNTDQILQLQLNDNDNPLDGARFQFDHLKKIGNLNWDFGYQFRYLNHPGDFDYFDRDLANNTWIENPLFTNGIKLKRKIHSVYNQFGGKANRWEYNAGLRLEYFDRSVTIDRPDETYTLDKWNLFPSLNFSYGLEDGLIAKGGYSRRIERTTTFKMTPFPEREHSETLEQGDAELLPEYIDLVELGLVKSWQDNSVFANIYYRKISNVINRVNTVFNDSILNRIYTNVGTGNVYGLELGTTLYPTSWARVYFGGNVYNYGIEGNLFGDDINTTSTIYTFNANTNFTINSSTSAQLALNYLSERITAQGEDSRFYNPSLSIKKSFLDNKFNVSFLWRNIDLGLLDSNEQRITTYRPNFFTTTNYVYEVDIMQLTFSYQLNKLSKKLNLIDSEFGKKEF